jgi:glutamyl-tRNA synthetase
MHRQELIERFSLERVGASPATLDYEKLDWMNGVFLRELPPEEYARDMLRWLREQGYGWPEQIVRASVPLVQEKLERLSQYPGYAGFLFEPVCPICGPIPLSPLRSPHFSRSIPGRPRASKTR